MPVRVYDCSGAGALAWDGDVLLDFAGSRRLLPDGTIEAGGVNYAYPFDRALVRDGAAVLYAALATKGIVLIDGRVEREIDRSFYHADAYEYPVALGAGRLVHCPTAYNRLEVEDLQGRPLAAGGTADFFHSRLALSPSGRRVLSAGWWWHPFDTVMVYDVGDLDAPLANGFELSDAEVEAAAFLDDDRVLIATSPEDERLDAGGMLMPGELAVWSLEGRTWLERTPLAERTGTVMPVGDEHVVGFHGHPRLIEIATGRVVERWEQIDGGRQTSSILADGAVPPSLALDPERRRFAVASARAVTVVEL